MSKAIFLDRDGVLIRTFVQNETPHPPQSLDAVEILPGVRRALDILRALDFQLLVVTNQPDVSRRTQTRQQVESINAALTHALSLDGVYVCYHDNADKCQCRKPAPGLLHQAAAERGIDLYASYMIGDRGSDIAAGAAAGCQTFLIEQSYSRCQPLKPTYQAADLLDAAKQIQDRVNLAITRQQLRRPIPV